MDNPNPLKYSDLVKEDNSITTLISQLEELGKVYDEQKAKIQGAAQAVRQSLQGVAGATDEQRKAIEIATQRSDELVKMYRDINTRSWQTTELLNLEKQAKKEKAQIDKLVTEIINSEEGSYKRLSAQYRLNKIRLDELAGSTRANSRAARELEAETKAIYEEMDRLQRATGKHQLNVGNYAEAAKDLRVELRSLTAQMAYLRTQGQGNTEEYQQMAQRAATLKQGMKGATAEIAHMGSATKELDAVMGAASAAGGGFAVFTGMTALLGEKDKEVLEAQKKLQAAIAITNGLRAIQQNLLKSSSLMAGIRLLQMKAAIKAEQLDTAAKTKNIIATKASVVAQKAFNVVANANPYVLLATALLTVVGAFALFSSGAGKAAEKQKELNEYTLKALEYQELYAQRLNITFNEWSVKIQGELEVAKAQGRSIEEIRVLEDKLQALRLSAWKVRKENSLNEYNDLQRNRKELARQEDILRKFEEQKVEGVTKVVVEGVPGWTSIEKAIEIIQGRIDISKKKIEIGVSLKTEEQDIKKQAELLAAQRKKEDQQRAKTERDTLSATNKMRIELVQESYEKQRKTIDETYEKQVADIRYRLQTETNLTLKTRKALNEQIELLAEKHNRDLEDLELSRAKKLLDISRQVEDAQLAAMADGQEKERLQLDRTYQRRIEDLKIRLNTERGLTVEEREAINKQIEATEREYGQAILIQDSEFRVQRLKAEADAIQLRLDAVEEGSQEEIDLTIARLNKEREIELEENSQLAKEVRQSEADINAKYDAEILRTTSDLQRARAELILKQQEDLQTSELDLMNANARQKERLSLELEKKRLQMMLELNKTASKKLTAEELKAIENTIAAINKKIASLPYNNFYELLGIGLDDEQQGALDAALSSIKDNIDSIIDSYTKAAEAAVASAEKQVSAAQSYLEEQIALREEGYANSVDTAQKELANAKKNREKALREQEKAQKAQLLLDTALQASSLVTATANIWKAFTTLGPFGIGAAIAAIATMWGSFAASKIKAAQVTKSSASEEKYAEGTVELLQGGSHASGHDIDLGTKPNGTRRRAEGGEFFAVINKRNSRKFRSVIPDVINAFNDGSFAEKYMAVNSAGVSFGYAGTDVSRLERDVNAIRQQGEQSRTVENGVTIIQYKNLTRKIKN